MSMRVVTPGETRTRVQRQPNFPIAGSLKPYGLYPAMATPVLPGETLLDFEMKRRMLSMPVRHPLVGAWLETWLVYVKLTDIDPALAEMFVSQDADYWLHGVCGQCPLFHQGWPDRLDWPLHGLDLGRLFR